MTHFNWTLPYPSQREPVLAKNMVSTSQPLAAQVGLQILREGGNAIDAAVATAATLTVIEPTSNGIGSDNFALVWAGGGLHGMNASGRAPQAMTPDRYKGQDAISTRGWDGVTVSGAVSGWVALSEKFGRLPFEKLLEPAIHYARNGFYVAPQTGRGWRGSQRAYRNFENWQSTFAPGGNAPGPGDFFKSEPHARSLEDIAATKGETFYRGDIAKKIAAHARATGGMITEDDLAAHQVDWVRPIEQDYHGFSLHQIPPNGQGLVGLIALGMLKHFRLDELEPDSPDSLHIQIEAMKLAFADGHRYIADPKWMDVEVADLLDPDYLEARAGLIDKNKATDFKHGVPKEGGTIYLTTADEEGNMVSFIQSNYTGFGSGIVIPDTGISLQNRGCCFSLKDGHPNQVGPGKRPYHTIIPGFVTKDGNALMSFGVMGGFMQPQGHAQVMVRLVTHHQNPQAALDASRFQITKGLKVSLEPGFDEIVYEDLKNRGHDLTIARARTVYHGGGQAIYRMENGGYFGASDLRRDGQAVGF